MMMMMMMTCTVDRVQAGQSQSVEGPLQFNAQFECGNLRKAIQVTHIHSLCLRQVSMFGLLKLLYLLTKCRQLCDETMIDSSTTLTDCTHVIA